VRCSALHAGFLGGEASGCITEGDASTMPRSIVDEGERLEANRLGPGLQKHLVRSTHMHMDYLFLYLLLAVCFQAQWQVASPSTVFSIHPEILPRAVSNISASCRTTTYRTRHVAATLC
jgi:hypothetical protein